MNQEKNPSELEVLSQAIGDLDRMRFVEGVSTEDRIAIEKRMIALRESERLCLQKHTQESYRKLETEIAALKTLKETFEQKWKPISRTQAVLDSMSRIIHSLLELSQQTKNFLK
jgi:hypothetical protein